MSNARNCVLGAAACTFLFFLGKTSSANVESSDFHTSAGDSLTWTAPGDDQGTGTAKSYDLRYSLTPITATNFSSATLFTNAPFPKTAGTVQTCYVNRLKTNKTYYFALKTVDDAGNWSGLSNVVSKATSSFVVGDANLDGIVNITDVIYLINFIFVGGEEPKPWGAGDNDCDAIVNIDDVIYLLAYVLTSGPAPGYACP